MELIDTVIKVNKLRVYAYHGALPQERILGGIYEVSLSIVYPVNADAYCFDNLAGTLNYAEAVEIAVKEMSTPCNLIEKAAWQISKALRLKYPQIKGGTVRIAKLHPPIDADLGQGVEVIMPILNHFEL